MAGGGAEGRARPAVQEEAAAAEEEGEEEEEEEEEDDEGLELASAPGTTTGYKGVYMFKVTDLPGEP